MNLLERITNFHFTAFVLTLAVTSGLVSLEVVDGGVFGSVIQTCFTVFVGGGVLKEASAAWASRGEK